MKKRRRFGPSTTNLVRNIRFLVDERAWTLTELARRSGVGRTQLHAILGGQSSPWLHTVEKLGAAFGVDVALMITPREEWPRISRRL